MDSSAFRTPQIPAKRRRIQDENIPPSPSTPALATPQLSRSSSPGPSGFSPAPHKPLSDKRIRTVYRNGFEVKPQTPSFRPYSVNNPGYPRQQAFAFSGFKRLKSMKSRKMDSWTALAIENGLLEDGQHVQAFQCDAANHVIAWTGDLGVIAPTGAGKSLLWMLPLLVQKIGISLVIIPYTSLGFQGEKRHEKISISCTFLHSGASDEKTLERIALGGGMHVIYTCVEMLETPAAARVIYSESFRAQLSGVYIDEAHVVHETHSWRPGYARLHLLRKILGTEIPLVAISATCPERYRRSVEVHAGLQPTHHLINLGSFRPELSAAVVRMVHSAASFLDLQFVLPHNATSESISQTIIYCDNLDMLTAMFWWFHNRLAALGLPAHLVDILHAGLSEAHQKVCIHDFMASRLRILLGSDKIGAGVDFPHVALVVQYRCHDLTLVRLIQRFGRGARTRGATALGVVIVEPSMLADSGLSVTSPKFEDPALLAYIHTDGCLEQVVDKWLENPPRLNIPGPQSTCSRCSNCNPAVSVSRQLVWIMEHAQHEAIPETQSPRTNGKTPTEKQRGEMYQCLVEWRFRVWKEEWMDKWPSYGPQSLITDNDLKEIAKRAHNIRSAADVNAVAQVPHLDDLSDSLLAELDVIFYALFGVQQNPNDVPMDEPAATVPPPLHANFSAVVWQENHTPETIQHSPDCFPKPSSLAEGEFILQFD
ncbi:hypothetical protein D9619_013674 [Psilocybe cf. subviscida]|uniref:DNA 3'-5' helicase n=1 Tax=Psilocybe cf. subviscida TaxID=2480587 RepID=A0A8H5AZ80_9AGAR|nr:hypothetical protein D9619_013674 [Psilocybe cf. subviscida]